MPRAGNLASARPPFFDRNPSQESLGAVDNTVEEDSSLATTWTYTVPTAHKAQVTLMVAELLTLVAADTTNSNHRALAQITVTPSGGSEFAILGSDLHCASMSAGDRSPVHVGSPSMLFAGDALKGNVKFDGTASGAGRVAYRSGALITEFDE